MAGGEELAGANESGATMHDFRFRLNREKEEAVASPPMPSAWLGVRLCGRAMAGGLGARRRWALGDYRAPFSEPRTPGERGDQGERVSCLCAAEESSFHGGSQRRHERPVGARG